MVQTFHDYEVVVVDDGSTDGSAQKVKNYCGQQVRLVQQKNKGVSCARNVGVHHAQAEYVAFLDADDYWTPIHLETLVRLMEHYPDAGIFSTAYNLTKPNGKLVWPNYCGIPPSPWAGKIPSYFKFAALTDLALSTSSLAIPKAVFWEMGGFQVGLNMYEDSYLWAKIALKYPIVFSWQVGSICDAYALNRLSNRPNLVMHPFIKYIEGNADLKDEYRDSFQNINEYITSLKIQLAEQYLMRGDRAQAKRILSSCRTKMLSRKRNVRLFLSLLPTTIFFSLWHMKRRIDEIIYQRDYSEDPWFK